MTQGNISEEDEPSFEKKHVRSKSLMNLKRRKQTHRLSKVQLPQPLEGNMNKVIKLEAIFNQKTPDNLPSTQLNQSRSIGETTLNGNNLNKNDENHIVVDINTTSGMKMFNQDYPNAMEGTMKSF